MSDISINPSSQRKSQVAIVGRPNVGKSTLFNILAEKRKALVKDQPGVTRDINMAPVELWGKEFDLIDTGGVTHADLPFAKEVRGQVKELLGRIDFALVVFDGREGLLNEDKEILDQVKRAGCPYLLVVNKLDKQQDELLGLSDFYDLGEDLQPTSFERRRGIDEVGEWIIARVNHVESEPEELRKAIAVVGKPNVGKSSLVNYLLGEEKMVVSDIAGTTADAIDTNIRWNNEDYLFIDTAGLRRTATHKADLEGLMAIKSMQAINRASIVVLMMDGLLGPSRQEARLMEMAWKKQKAVVLAVNKSDLGRKEIANYRQVLRENIIKEFHFYPEIPTVFISAKTGQGMDQLFATIDDLWKKLNVRVSTGKVNDFLVALTKATPPPICGTKNVKFYYFTQTKQLPPSFITFVNQPKGVTEAYKRFLVKSMRKEWDLDGIPIRIFPIKKK